MQKSKTENNEPWEHSRARFLTPPEPCSFCPQDFSISVFWFIVSIIDLITENHLCSVAALNQ